MYAEAWLTVLDFTISVYGSSCKSYILVFGLSAFLSASSHWHPILRLGEAYEYIERGSKGVRMRPKNKKLHVLPDTEVEKSGTIRLASVVHMCEHGTTCL